MYPIPNSIVNPRVSPSMYSFVSLQLFSLSERNVNIRIAIRRRYSLGKRVSIKKKTINGVIIFCIGDYYFFVKDMSIR